MTVPLRLTAADKRIRFQALEDQRDRLFDEGRTLWEVWGPEAEEAATRLLEGEETPLTRLIDALYGLAITARAHPILESHLREPPLDVYATLEGLLQDEPVSQFRGRARIMRESHKLLELEPGDILVAPISARSGRRSSPCWAGLF